MLNRLINFLGIELSEASHTEKLVSGVGGFLAIYLIFVVSHLFLGDDAYLIVTSMGAATILLFAVPHGPLSQPWPLFGGNLISALIGVSCAQWIPDIFVAAALAVGLSVSAMYYLKCIHPPGGATALAAVISGPSVASLGYMYVITPVLFNVMLIFIIAVSFNAMFKWRRYPAALAADTNNRATSASISHAGIEHALKQMDAFVDVGEEDLNRIYDLAREFDKQQSGQGLHKKKR